MGRVSWSDSAEADVAGIDHAVIYQLKRIAEEILHDIPPIVYPADEGYVDNIMWCRAITREQEHQMEAGGLQETEGGIPVWDYFFLYTKQESGEGFEVLAVLNVHQVASRWLQMTRES